MNTHSFLVILITVNCIDLPFLVFGDEDTVGSQSFSERIITLQTDTQYLCNHIEEISFGVTKRLKTLIQDAHIYCPDIKRMEIQLINIETMAGKYHALVADQLNDCQELSKMLNRGLENGGLVVFYLKEGNYSFVTSIIDNWHEKFTKFHATFFLTDTPLEIMLKDKKVFYYNNWLENMFQTILRLALFIVGPVALSSILVWIGSTFGIIAALTQFFMDFRQKQLSTNLDSSERKIVNNISDDQALQYNETTSTKPEPAENDSVNTIVDNRSLRRRKNSVVPDIMNHAAKHSIEENPRLFYLILIGILSLVLIIAVWICFPTTVSSARPVLRHWYPDATIALETLRTNRDNLHSNLSRQILSIEELQRHASMYHDETIQANVDEFIRVLGEGVRHTSKELADVYILSEKMPSTFRRAYKSIEARAKKIGKLSEVNELLAELNKSAEKHEKFMRALQASVVHQQKILPILKKQTQSIQTLVREDQLVEIGRVINHHQNELMEISGTIYKVQVQLTNFIQVISDEHIDGMKKTIELLSDDSAKEQIKVMVAGIAGSATSTIMGVLAIKTGYALVTVTAVVAAGPALGVASIVGGVGMLGLGGYWATGNFDKYNELSHFQNELAGLEKERMRLQVAMEKVEEGITAQQNSLQSSESSLRKIANHCGRFSKIPGFTLNKNQRNAINDELLNAIAEYNRLMAVYSLFTESMDSNQKALPSE
ncbi:hypothetical protein I4U23_000234 [Adineta vaga]|nr:hypothetical protein I4U23_000234 [Adineta vaga]